MTANPEQLSFHSESGWRIDHRPTGFSPQPINRPSRPTLGTELIEDMQQKLRECVMLGTISLENCVQLYGDWLTEDYT